MGWFLFSFGSLIQGQASLLAWKKKRWPSREQILTLVIDWNNNNQRCPQRDLTPRKLAWLADSSAGAVKFDVYISPMGWSWRHLQKGGAGGTPDCLILCLTSPCFIGLQHRLYCSPLTNFSIFPVVPCMFFCGNTTNVDNTFAYPPISLPLCFGHFPDFIGKAKQRIKREVSDAQPLQGAYKYRPPDSARQDIGMLRYAWYYPLTSHQHNIDWSESEFLGIRHAMILLLYGTVWREESG